MRGTINGYKTIKLTALVFDDIFKSVKFKVLNDLCKCTACRQKLKRSANTILINR